MTGRNHEGGQDDPGATIGGDESAAATLTVAGLFGSVPAMPGRETVDFAILIEEAMDEEADRIVRAFEGQ